MRRFLIIAAVLVLLCLTLSFAAEKPPAAAPAPPRIPEMTAAGKVVEISDTVLKIERAMKAKVENMEFVLERPFPNIAVGDHIKVTYLEKEGRKVLIRFAPAQKTAVQKQKKEAPKAATPPRPQAAPVIK